MFESTNQAQAIAEPNEPETPDSGSPGFADAMRGQTIATGSVHDLNGQIVATTSVGDGCYGQAMSAVFGSPQAYIEFFTKLQKLGVITGASWNALRDTPDYLTRNQLWSQCMKNAGFDYPTTFDPQNRDWPSPRPSHTEQQVAEADSTCRQRRALDGADLYLIEGHALSSLLVGHPVGDYTEFDRQVQALLAGFRPSTVGNQTPASTSTLS
jgi:hypothetical protein